MKHAEDLTDIPSHVDDDSVKKAFHTIERFGWKEGELLEYEDSQLAIYDEQGRLDDSYSKGIAAGIEKGIEKGKVEGIAEGEQRGERAKAIAIAKTMLADKFPVETIVKYTGLTQEEILKII
jgi:predicted transposase/invertase (TIGR01784 family)